jgi:hypothetical protein
MTRWFVALGVVVLLGCQPAAVPVAPTEVVAPVAASASVWGEVPKQCA